MRIVCPNCDTAYDVPESVVAAGRHMRCVQCRTEWIPGKPVDVGASAPGHERPQEAEPDAAPDVPDAAPELPYAPLPAPSAPQANEAPTRAAEPVILAPFPSAPAPESPRKAVMAAWAASMLVLVAAIWLAIAFRQPVMRHWPASARAYAALGFR